jgi:maltose O-acetyltransferase
VMIDACGQVAIGHGNMIGPGVYITDTNHTVERGRSSASLPLDIEEVHIASNCWVGAKAVILKGVSLGDNCVVAAGAVVTESFPPGSVLAGVPARMIRTLRPALAAEGDSFVH